MSETTAPPLEPDRDLTTQYNDTLALNDIHVVVTSPSMKGADRDALQAIEDILARAGRSPYPSRIITATVEEGPYGIPVARINAEGTVVTVGQGPRGPGIRIHIAPRDPADEAALVLAVGDTVVHRTRSIGLRQGGQS